MHKILIAIPTFENILPDTFKSIYGLQIPDDCVCQFDFVKGYDCAKARNDIAKEALKYEFNYVLMVDSDMIIPDNTLVSMLRMPADICLGVYPRKNTSSGQTECFKMGQKNYIDVYTYDELDQYDNSFVQIKGGGLGCALIKTDVFEKIVFPYFKYVVYDNGDVLSEDNYFCSKATAAEYKIFMDTNVRCGHSIRGFQWR